MKIRVHQKWVERVFCAGILHPARRLENPLVDPLQVDESKKYHDCDPALSNMRSL